VSDRAAWNILRRATPENSGFQSVFSRPKLENEAHRLLADVLPSDMATFEEVEDPNADVRFSIKAQQSLTHIN
jgi:hypothetical protein